jgi:hypothetical protein
MWYLAERPSPASIHLAFIHAVLAGSYTTGSFALPNDGRGGTWSSSPEDLNI